MQTSQRRSAIVGMATQIEAATNAGIQAKHDLGEDRALVSLARTVCRFIGNPEIISRAELVQALDHYQIREIQTAVAENEYAPFHQMIYMSQSGCTFR